VINNSYLLGLYGGSAFDTTSSATSAALRQAAKKQPTPPWSTDVVAPKQDVLVRAALGGRKFINEDAAQLDMKSAPADYRKLFALYQGLDTLNALTNRSATKGVTSLEMTQLNKRFTAGLAEIGSWLSSAGFEGVRMVQGTAKSISKTTAAIPRDSAVSVTGPIHEGAIDSAVAAFAGDIRFNITIKVPVGVTGSNTTAVPIDLAGMGAKPRTLDNVLEFVNNQLETAGFATRIGREQIKAEPKTMQVNGKTVTLPAGPDKWALAIRGNSTETVGFTAADTSDAVYVVQAAGTAGGNQLLKFQSDGGSHGGRRRRNPVGRRPAVAERPSGRGQECAGQRRGAGRLAVDGG
jgi:hypothetical protein